MAKRNEVAVGQRWAYRVSAVDEFVEVKVAGLNLVRPSQLNVTFINGERAGKTVEVPITRLKVLWSARAGYLQSESQWSELVSSPGEIESGAVESVLHEFLWPAAGFNSEKTRRGTVTIFDDDLVDVFIGGGLGEILANQPSVIERDGVAHYGWIVALQLAQRVSARKPDRVMAYVHGQEADSRSRTKGLSTRAVADAVYYDSIERPMLDLIRSWCGEAAGLQDEVRKLRSEVSSFESLFAGAVALLVDANEEDVAWAVYRTAYPSADMKEWVTSVAAEATARRAWRANLTSRGGHGWVPQTGAKFV